MLRFVAPKKRKRASGPTVELLRSPEVQVPKHLEQQALACSRLGPAAGRQATCVRGYYNVLKASLQSPLPALQKCFTAVPRSFGGPQKKRPAGYPVWRDNGQYLCVPRHVGLHMFGSAGLRNLTVAGEPLSHPGCFAGELRGFQRDIVEHVSGRYRRAGPLPEGAVVVASCGTGKTVMTIALICEMGRKTAIVVHQDFLLQQWKSRIEEFAPSLSVGIVQRDRVEVEGRDVVIFMMHSLVMQEGSRYPRSTFEPFGLLVFDETHHLAAKMFIRSAGLFPSQYRLGLTATPDRPDGLGYLVTWVLGPVVCRAQRGSANTAVKVIPHAYPAEYPVLRDRFGQVAYVRMVSALVGDTRRTDYLCRLVAAVVRDNPRRCVLVASDRIKHLTEMMRRCDSLLPDGVRTGMYVGASTKKKKAAREENGKLCRVLFTTFRMGEEGLDLPRMNTLVLASPKKRVEQLVGRITRGNGDHPLEPLVYDVYEPRVPLFASMYKKRRATYRRLHFSFAPEGGGVEYIS